MDLVNVVEEVAIRPARPSASPRASHVNTGGLCGMQDEALAGGDLQHDNA
jgi:hypothetical protein